MALIAARAASLPAVLSRPSVRRVSVSPETASAAVPEIAPPAQRAIDRAGVQLQRWRQGDDAGFAELIADHQEAAFLTARRITADSEAAADVVQESFLRLLRHADDYQPDRPFRPWFLQIVRNLAIDCLRRRRPGADPERSDLTAPGSDPGRALQASELRVRVARILGLLPDKYRTILIQREMEGLAAEAIAEDIGIDYGTTRWRLHQARRLFREAWVAEYGEEF